MATTQLQHYVPVNLAANVFIQDANVTGGEVIVNTIEQL